MTIDKQKLAFAMAKKGLNFKQLAPKSGVSRATLSYINNGKQCSAGVALKIAAALDLKPETILQED